MKRISELERKPFNGTENPESLSQRSEINFPPYNQDKTSHSLLKANAIVV